MRRCLLAWSEPLALSLGAALANGLLPSLAISLFALVVPDGARISAFASAVAEPLALLGSLALTVAVAAWSPPVLRPGRRWGAILGLSAAAGVVLGSAMAGDLDGWSAATVVLLPAGAVLAADVRARRRPGTPHARAAGSDEPARSRLASPPDGASAPRRPADGASRSSHPAR